MKDPETDLNALSRAIPAMVAALEEGFMQSHRALPWREHYDPWEVWVSEIMLQQTRVDVVVGYFERFIRRFPTVSSLAQASEEEVLGAWSGLGYYRRAKMLRRGAIEVVERHGGMVPRDLDALRSIPGIGRYTSGAIASIAFDQTAAIVDGNVLRVMSRLAGLKDPIGSGRLEQQVWELAESFVREARSPRMLNQALMEHGALVCRPRAPRCESCPVAAHCVARGQAKPEGYPVRPEKRATIRLEIPLFIVVDDAERILMRKESGRLMSAMYHLPHGNDLLLPGSAVRGLINQVEVGTIRHTVTHRRIEFRIFAATVQRGARLDPEQFCWIDPEELVRLPHPSYVRKALLLAAERMDETGWSEGANLEYSRD